MLGAPTYQLRDLGPVASSLCLSLLACEPRAQRPPRRTPVEPECTGLQRRGVGGVRGPHTHPGRGPPPRPGHGRQHQLPQPSRGPPHRCRPYMTPQAPRRSLPQSVLGPGSRAPPRASSSTGHRAGHLPSSPRTPIAAQPSASRDVAPVRPCALGAPAPPPLWAAAQAGPGAGPGPAPGSGEVRTARGRPGRAGQAGPSPLSHQCPHGSTRADTRQE